MTRREENQHMASSAKTCLAHLSRLPLRPSIQTAAQLPQAIFLPSQQIRCATTGTSANAAKYRSAKKNQTESTSKKKKSRTTFINYDLRLAKQFSLCDAMQYVLPPSERELGLTRRLSDTSKPLKSVVRPPLPNTNCTSSSAH